MAVIQSGRIVHLDQSGKVIWEECPNPSTIKMEERAEVIQSDWLRKTTKTNPKKLPVTSIEMSVPVKNEGGFGYDFSKVPRGRRYVRFGRK